VVTRIFSNFFNGKVYEMVKVISLPAPASQDAEDHARDDTQRNQRLFDWADTVLKRLRLDKAVAGARSIEELRAVTFDADSVEITLAIRDALHPATGHRQQHFRGLKEGRLQRVRCHQTAAAVGRRSGRHALDRPSRVPGAGLVPK